MARTKIVGSHTKSNRSAKENLKASVKRQFQELELAAEVVTWEAGGGSPYATVKQALIDNGLDDDVCKELAARYAFSRAAKKLEQDERVIKVTYEDKDEVRFQFTKMVMISGVDEDSGTAEREWEFRKECKLSLDKATGIVKCKLKDLEKQAQQLVNNATELKTNSDITGIVQRLYQRHGELMPLRSSGGVYLVLKNYFAFNDKVEGFLKAIGGKLDRWPIPAGTQRGDTLISETVAESSNKVLEEFEAAISEFNMYTPKTRMEAAVERIKEGRIRIEARANYLRDNADVLLEKSKQLEQELVKKIEQLGKEREAALENGESVGGVDFLGCRVNSAAGHINKFLGPKPKSVEEIVKESEISEDRVKSHLVWWYNKGKLGRTAKNEYFVKKEDKK